MESLRLCLLFWKREEAAAADEPRRIEDYRPGYPRFTALLSAHKPFLICRTFNKVRARLLLLKQDRLCALEQGLEEVDREEPSPLFLGKSRCDRNDARKSLLSEIEVCLADYDQFVERTSRMLGLGSAQPRDVESLQNWLEGTGCLDREEAAYLTHRHDLTSLAPMGDTAVLQLETWIEDRLIRLWRGFRKNRFHVTSNDANVYIYTGPVIRRTAKALLLVLISVLLLTPVIICNLVGTFLARIFVIMVSTACYLLILSELTKSRAIELTLAGATVTKDPKAHMLTHQNERPEKCPIQTCEYHIKGFARKYDRNRHTLTHYEGAMVCGFCTGPGSPAEKSFNRADVFKRHLTAVHGVEPPKSAKETVPWVGAGKRLVHTPTTTSKCTTCSQCFDNAQDLYEHLDGCVRRIVLQRAPAETTNARRLAEGGNDGNVPKTLEGNSKRKPSTYSTDPENICNADVTARTKQVTDDEKNSETSKSPLHDSVLR
ncbi:hypothetical protein Purlil1_12547 [Purpureocillium lilacinum]|uniref:DUF6594 domain-containing protein n=1 Tax=Purpureocillium lilacinum TaxID=33203 RepID=A0ABR0BGM3_PURLI|nr:hypothetical protein Purlil1_12547 [Purpureocillium lilacinum]